MYQVVLQQASVTGTRRPTVSYGVWYSTFVRFADNWRLVRSATLTKAIVSLAAIYADGGHVVYWRHRICIYQLCQRAELLLLSLISPRGIAMPNGLYLCFFFFVFDAQYLRSLNGSQLNFDTYSLMTVIWKIWSKLARSFTFPPRAGGKNRFWTDLELWPNTSLQRNTISTIGKKLDNLQGLPYMPR